MTRTRRHRWIFGILAALLFALTPWPRAWPQEKEPIAGVTHAESLEKRVRIAVHDGRLSVDLRDAGIGEMLALIGEQAGIAIHVGPTVSKTISAQFTAVELEQGLRRLLQRASLSYAILYAQGPAGAASIKEIWVFAPGKAPAPSQAVATPHTAEHGKSEAARLFREALERGRQGSPPAAADAESEAARLFREALERGRQGSPPAAADAESEAARLFREALERAAQRGAGSLPPTGPRDAPRNKTGEQGGAAGFSQ